MKLFICQSCNHVAHDQKPDRCPVCGTYIFMRNDSIFKESAETSGEAAVKHVPSITLMKSCGFIPENDCVDVLVRIGETLHPMEDKHYIDFIDCYGNFKFIGRVFLTPHLNPAACFHLKIRSKNITVVEHCTVHGYWMADQEVGE